MIDASEMAEIEKTQFPALEVEQKVAQEMSEQHQASQSHPQAGSQVEGRPSGTQPMQHGHRPASAEQVPATLVPVGGWHFLHMFYRVDRAALSQLPKSQRASAMAQLAAAMSPAVGEDKPITQMHTFAVVGHKADFGFVASGPDIRALNGVQMAMEASDLGPALVPTYSFYSITEISEYVPTAEQYGQTLLREGLDPESDMFKTKVRTYEQRLVPMNKQRLLPEFPDWPSLCFYPMSKTRVPDANWYSEPFSRRSEMMAQHGKSGMKFAGKVIQVVTSSTGLDDWEWGVTLWGKNPSYLKDIVYTMRFDESSAKFGLFGDFYFGYRLPPEELLKELQLEKQGADTPILKSIGLI